MHAGAAVYAGVVACAGTAVKTGTAVHAGMEALRVAAAAASRMRVVVYTGTEVHSGPAVYTVIAAHGEYGALEPCGVDMRCGERSCYCCSNRCGVYKYVGVSRRAMALLRTQALRFSQALRRTMRGAHRAGRVARDNRTAVVSNAARWRRA